MKVSEWVNTHVPIALRKHFRKLTVVDHQYAEGKNLLLIRVDKVYVKSVWNHYGKAHHTAIGDKDIELSLVNANGASVIDAIVYLRKIEDRTVADLLQSMFIDMIDDYTPVDYEMLYGTDSGDFDQLAHTYQVRRATAIKQRLDNS